MAKPTKDNRWNDIDGGAAFLIPLTLFRHPNFVRLTPHGNKLLMDLCRQFSGFNNGFLCASWSLMQDAGWRSPSTLRVAMLELEHYRLIERTRQGGRNMATLHAITWRRIDSKKDRQLDVQPTVAPSDAWKEDRPVFNPTAKRRAKKRRGVHLRSVA
jgi:hypothetical protein